MVAADAVNARLRDFLNFTVADAGCTGTDTLVRAVDDCPDGLKIDVPAAVGHVMGVADLMPKLRTLAA